MNAVLGWLFTPGAGHGLGVALLTCFCERLDLDSMLGDLRRDGLVEVHVESSPPDGFEGRAPDLLFRTAHAALLVENKVESGWSDEKQAHDYIMRLREWAGDRDSCAVLLAPQRYVHLEKWRVDGWQPALAHSEVAGILEALAMTGEHSAWTNVTLLLLANDLRGSDQTRTLAKLQKLVASLEGRQVRLGDAQRLTTLTVRINAQHPWNPR